MERYKAPDAFYSMAEMSSPALRPPGLPRLEFLFLIDVRPVEPPVGPEVRRLRDSLGITRVSLNRFETRPLYTKLALASLFLTMIVTVSSTPEPPCVSEVLKDQLFVGNLSAALSVEQRQCLSITHVLSICPGFPSTGPKHMNIPIEDSEYEDLLIHLPQGCRFIESALDQGGRVLVHCVMGISRSVAVVAAFLMQSRKMTTHEALRFVKKIRPQAHPNYGFIKQLDVFRKCNFEPSPSHPAYRSWKRRNKQDVTHYLNHVADTVSIIEDKLLLTSAFPSDAQQAQSYLLDLGVAHLISISPSTATVPSLVRHHHLNVDSRSPEGTLLALSDIVARIHDAVEKSDGLVLVHSLMESRACTAVCAYLMAMENKSPDQAFSVIEDALPLFNPTKRFAETLQLFHACGYAPSANHPVIKDWLASQRRPSSSNSHSSLASPKRIGNGITANDAEKRSQPNSGFSSYYSSSENHGAGASGFKDYIRVHGLAAM